MKSPSTTIARPSLNPRNPRNKELFDWLVGLIETSGGPVRLPISDDLLALDLASDLSFLPRSSRLVWMKAAKRAVLDAYLVDCVDQIGRAVEDDGDIAVLLGGFVPDDFPGRDNRLTPPDHATLTLKFYGEPLSSTIVRKWTKRAFVATLPATGRVEPVVYFISLENPARVKIGFSGSLSHRLRALRTASSVEPTIHLTLPGDRALEAALREQFRVDHIVREWFHLSPAITDFIAERKRGP